VRERKRDPYLTAFGFEVEGITSGKERERERSFQFFLVFVSTVDIDIPPNISLQIKKCKNSNCPTQIKYIYSVNLSIKESI
jgi:hypothetical protein